MRHLRKSHDPWFDAIETDINFKRSHVTGRHLIRGTPVVIASAFTPAELAAQRALKLSDPRERNREWWGKVAQKIPLAGRLIAHCTVNYWVCHFLLDEADIVGRLTCYLGSIGSCRG